jgi:hypothetical protein
VEADDTRKELREEEDLLRAAEEGSHDLLTRDPTRVSPTHIPRHCRSDGCLFH